MHKATLEIFVVDNASSDGSAEMVEKEFPEIQLIKNAENLGFAKANNQAIRHSRGKYILLLNPDTVVQGDALDTMVLFMDDHKDVGAVGPRILNPDNRVQLTCGRHFPTPLTELWDLTKLSDLLPNSRIFGKAWMSFWAHSDTMEVELLSGACMMVSREAIDQVGLIDEHFFLFAEDTEWCYRIKKNGWKIYLNADAEVMHLWQQSMKLSSTNTALESHKSMHLFFMKHYGRRAAIGYRAMVFIFIGLRIPVYWVWHLISPSTPIQIGRLWQIVRWSIYLES